MWQAVIKEEISGGTVAYHAGMAVTAPARSFMLRKLKLAQRFMNKVSAQYMKV
jgi:hypothetical protein